MLLKLSGDYSALLKEIHDTSLMNPDWNWYSSPEKISTLVKELETNLAKEAGWRCFYGFSYFAYGGARTINWHVDGASHTIIMAYHHPTQFFMISGNPFEFENPGNLGIDILKTVYEVAKEKSKDTNMSVFTPPVGIPYLFTNNTVHRSNPKGLGTPHLVIRVCENA